MLAHAGMLSSSSEKTNTPVDLAAITDPSIDPLTPGGVELLRLVDAVLARSADISRVAEEVKTELGPTGLIDAAGVIGNYQMMNRVADGTGIPVGKGSRLRNAELINRLGLDRLDHTDG